MFKEGYLSPSSVLCEDLCFSLVDFSYEAELSSEINLEAMPHVEMFQFLLPLSNSPKII